MPVITRGNNGPSRNLQSPVALVVIALTGVAMLYLVIQGGPKLSVFTKTKEATPDTHAAERMNAAVFRYHARMANLSAAEQAVMATTTRGGSSSSGSGSHQVWSPLGIPQGKADNLPSVLVEDGVNREHGKVKYGGEGDKAHLGGFTTYDGQGVSPDTWKYMIEELGVKSMMDVGCGKGVSTLWFHFHSVKVLCLEGSHDAVSHTLLPDPANQVVEHDFSRGPYWPEETYDAIWCVEFLEHVGRNFQYNYIQAFRKAALIFMSHSTWGGWHHVEVHDSDWWITRFESFGFKHSPHLTKQVREIASNERDMARKHPTNSTFWGPDDAPRNAQHVWLNMQVFINPMVASLPEHAHLMAEHGCYAPRVKDKLGHKECGTGKSGNLESTLPPSYYPLKLTPDQDQAWLDRMKQHIAENQPPPEQ